MRVMGNLGVLAFWIVLAANFISREWVRPSLESKGACVLGVMAGTGLWFFGLSYAVSVRRKKSSSEKTLLRMQRGSGLSPVVAGAGAWLPDWSGRCIAPAAFDLLPND